MNFILGNKKYCSSTMCLHHNSCCCCDLQMSSFSKRICFISGLKSMLIFWSCNTHGNGSTGVKSLSVLSKRRSETTKSNKTGIDARISNTNGKEGACYKNKKIKCDASSRSMQSISFYYNSSSCCMSNAIEQCVEKNWFARFIARMPK